MKKIINVLWAIEKDLRVIASNTEVLKRMVETTRKGHFPGIGTNFNQINYIYFYRTWKGNVPVLTGSSTELDEILFPTKAAKKVLIESTPSQKNLYVQFNGRNFRVL